MMKCPNCDSPMDPHDRHGVQIEHCPACGGVWLDRGELEHLIEAVRPAVTLPDPEPVRPKPAGDGRGRTDGGTGRSGAERFEDRVRTVAPQPGESHRYRGKYSRKPRIRDLIEEIFDFD